MDNFIGILNNTNLEANFNSLCKNRPVYMLPFASRYRLVDVCISNMVNNGIKTVAIYTGEKIRSTMDHLSDGKPWNLNSRFQGLFLYPPITQELSIERLGDLADFYSTLSFLETAREENVMVQDSNVIFMKNLDEAYKKFTENDADILMMYVKQSDSAGEYVNTDKLHLDQQGYVTNIGINLGTETEFNMYINTLFIKKEVLINLIKESVEKGNASSLKDAIIKNKNTLNIMSYPVSGFVEIIKDSRTYFHANLSLLDMNKFKELFINNGRVMTKTKDEPSTIYRDYPEVENSLIANGCEIEGDVENSIIFRGVKIGKNAIVKNSIIMQKTVIEEGAVVVNSIIDKYSIVEKEVSLVGSVNQPYIVGKSEVAEKD
ncbi:MAG: glucose-1-phosphate adenylyltransferase subunit GlgD [Tissierellia bacterium]|nr:glucose-1-phosphate adenylyltransferase subunit GlgD [Tissierellia bacterium]